MGRPPAVVIVASHDPSTTLEAVSDEVRQPRSLEAHDDDDDVDTVLVLVTHGAGCNALIGALTNQPVLIDVGMASLTLAVQKSIDYRRVASPTQTSASPPRRRQSMVDFGISDDYEVKLVASTEHLRAGSSFLKTGTKLQRAPSLPLREKSPYRYERPGFALHHPATSTQDKLAVDGDIATSSAEVHSNRESSTSTKMGLGELHTPTTAASSGGLWSMPLPKNVEDSDKKYQISPSPKVSQKAVSILPELDGVSEESDDGRSTPKTSDDNRTISPSKRNDHGRSIVRSGLWGAPPQALATERDKGAKRRWTLSQAA
ncbi:hypothetical protein P7C71_g3568, partial [Lecanoromycetidae sp. Uapishka_2]